MAKLITLLSSLTFAIICIPIGSPLLLKPTGIDIVGKPSKLGAGLSSILFLAEIIVGVVSASILTNEPFGWRETIGSILIILGGVIEVVYVPKSEKKLA